MKKAVFISLLVFVVFLLSSCAWMSRQVFDLTGKWVITPEVGEDENHIVGIFHSDYPSLAKITQDGTKILIDWYDYSTTQVSDSDSSTTTYKIEHTITFKGEIINQTIVAATNIINEEIPATATFSINADVINNNFIKGYLTFTITNAASPEQNGRFTAIFDGSRYEWSDELLGGIVITFK